MFWSCCCSHCWWLKKSPGLMIICFLQQPLISKNISDNISENVFGCTTSWHSKRTIHWSNLLFLSILLILFFLVSSTWQCKWTWNYVMWTWLIVLWWNLFSKVFAYICTQLSVKVWRHCYCQWPRLHLIGQVTKI